LSRIKKGISNKKGRSAVLISLESPVSTLRTPSGTPALMASSARAKAVRGVELAGLRMTYMAIG
jgi:hypothetical protein